MNVIIQILPTILTFCIGFLLKKTKVFKAEDAGIFLRLNFYVAAPAIVLKSLSSIDLQPHQFLLFLFPFIVVPLLYGISWITAKKLHLAQKKKGVFIIATLIMNTMFTLPFLQNVYGDEALTRLFILDAGNAVVVFTAVFAIACHHADVVRHKSDMVKKMFQSPPLIAVIIALLVNFLNLLIMPPFSILIDLLSNLAGPMVMLALGIYFTPHFEHIKAVLIGELIRKGMGFTVGLIFATLIGLQGLDRIVVVVAASAPFGFNTLTFSSLEKLDEEFAASMVSTSILIGLFTVPLVILLVG